MGEKGIKGDDLQYDDLTLDQKIELKGERGIKGKTGEKLKYNDLSRYQINELSKNISKNINKDEIKGDKGIKGEIGRIGKKGEKGRIGIQGLQGNKGSKGSKGNIGFKGQKGEIGNTPIHQWNNTRIRFETRNSKKQPVWGNYVNLIGQKGEKGNNEV